MSIEDEEMLKRDPETLVNRSFDALRDVDVTRVGGLEQIRDYEIPAMETNIYEVSRIVEVPQKSVEEALYPPQVNIEGIHREQVSGEDSVFLNVTSLSSNAVAGSCDADDYNSGILSSVAKVALDQSLDYDYFCEPNELYDSTFRIGWNL